MKRQQSFLQNHPVIGGLILLIFLWLCFAGVVGGVSRFISNPMGCPTGYVATGDRYDQCEPAGNN